MLLFVDARLTYTNEMKNEYTNEMKNWYLDEMKNAFLAHCNSVKCSRLARVSTLDLDLGSVLVSLV